ncbi:MAG: hypothetical protein VW518_09780 [Burkholderiaceae bacterium]|jgi:hypothetical protein
MNSREKANQASAILNNEVFKEVLDNLEKGLITQWSISETVPDRELCWMKLNALKSITEELQAIIQNDKIENFER